MRHVATVQLAICLLLLVGREVQAAPPGMVRLNDDGGWCWFEDERAVIYGQQLIVGTIAAGAHDAGRRGNVEVASYHLQTGAIQRTVLHVGFPCDDHNSPALLVRGDGRLLAMYCPIKNYAAAHGITRAQAREQLRVESEVRRALPYAGKDGHSDDDH